MSKPRITVGLPVYKGADLITKALDCLQRQTFPDFEAIISIDGADEETAAACQPFLSDSRFRMVVQSDRLDWVGNFNWLLRRDLQEFFCYQQHDDTVAPEFFETLLQTADVEPNAVAIYCDCRYSGRGLDHEYVEKCPSITGDEPLDRVFQYVQRASAAPVRGLIRRRAIQNAGPVRSDEFRGVLQIFGWLAKLLHWGTFERVAKPIYYRRYRANSLGHEPSLKQAAWPTMFTTLLDAAIPICHTRELRLFMQQLILCQVVDHSRCLLNSASISSDAIIAKCVQRVKDEEISHLLDEQELKNLQGQRRPVEAMLLERSRLRKAMHETRQVFEFASLIYAHAPVRRASYQVRHSADLLRRLLGVLSRPILI